MRPDVVMVELCKDRLPLLVEPTKDAPVRRIWHSRKVVLDGLPPDPEWPRPAQLRSLLHCQVGRPLNQDDIELDAVRLLSTGLFRSVKPACDPPALYESPEFAVEEGPDGKVQVYTIPPLGAVRFVVTERKLPPITTMTVRLDSSLRDAVPASNTTGANGTAATSGSSSSSGGGSGGEGGVMSALEAVAAAAVKGSQEGVASLNVYLRARAAFMEVFQQPVAVAFKGVENGKVEVLVKAVKPGDRPYLSGLEGTAEGGVGMNIEPFKPMRQSAKLTNKMFLPAETLQRLRAAREASRSQSGGGSRGPSPLADVAIRSEVQDWDYEVVDAGVKGEEVPSQPLADIFSALLTSLYAGLQRSAANKTGIEAGEVWRAALAAASEVGSQQVVLGDRPSRITERRMADEMLGATGARVAGALVLVLGTLVGAASSSVLSEAQELGALAAATLGASLLMQPVVGPFLEMSQLAGLSGDEIERRVELTSPLQAAEGQAGQPVRIFGEDALLDWPGVQDPLISERDAYMARVLAAAASGRSCQSPALVLDRVAVTSKTAQGDTESRPQLVWRYRVPRDAPTQAAPQGLGDGTYEPLPAPQAIVAVVGTAHVAGMLQKWRESLSDTSVTPLLQL